LENFVEDRSNIKLNDELKKKIESIKHCSLSHRRIFLIAF